MKPIVLDALLTEQQNTATASIDAMTTEEILNTINREDQTVAQAVAKEIPSISRAVEVVVQALSSGHRLVYIGAGTSGRLGVLDAAECPPTFGVLEGMVMGIIAGGHDALVRAAEGMEDIPEAAVRDLQQIGLTCGDVVVGLAASGRTPYVLGGMDYARQLGCTTVGISCSEHSELSQQVDMAITPLVGPEVITGSTRMKAGTAQKLILNMLTTTAMIKLGKVYGNLMVDVQPTNDKLHERARRIVTQLTGVTAAEADQALKQCGYHVKTTVVMLKRGCSPQIANTYLQQAHGSLRLALQ